MRLNKCEVFLHVNDSNDKHKLESVKNKKKRYDTIFARLRNFALLSLLHARLINKKCHQVEQQMPDPLPCSEVYQLPVRSRYSASLALIRALMRN